MIAAGLRRFRHGELTTEVNVERVDARLLRIKGQVVDASGSAVGRFTRTYFNRDGEWEARHEALYLEGHIHNGGFGRAFQWFSEGIYSQQDVRQVSMMAEEVGAYAWHSHGFRLAGTDERRREQFVAIWLKHGGKNRAQAAVDAGHLRQVSVDKIDELVEAVIDGNKEPLEPFEIARLGADVQWVDDAGRSVWLGRVVLTGAIWVGVKRL